MTWLPETAITVFSGEYVQAKRSSRRMLSSR
jgi:hypothetical protein